MDNTVKRLIRAIITLYDKTLLWQFVALSAKLPFCPRSAIVSHPRFAAEIDGRSPNHLCQNLFDTDKKEELLSA